MVTASTTCPGGCQQTLNNAKLDPSPNPFSFLPFHDVTDSSHSSEHLHMPDGTPSPRTMGVWLNSKAFLAISAMCISPILYIYLRNPDGLWATVKDLQTAVFHNDSRTAALFTTKLPPTKEQLIDNIIKSHSNGSYLSFDNARTNLTTLLNASCSDGYKVPPIVHYVWFSKVTMEIHEYISVLSLSKFVKPCYILFHGDRVPAGKWWDRLLSEVHNIIHVTVPLPDSVFGRHITRVQHRSDVVRLRVLLQYGGIYVDGDQYVLRSLDPLRNYTVTLGREDFQSLANSIILANKESTFLKIWLLSYHMFDDTKWVYNSLRMAHKLNVVLSPLLHVEEKGMIWMGRGYGSVYHEDLPWDQTDWYSVHLYSRWFKKRDYEIEDLKKMNSTYGVGGEKLRRARRNSPDVTASDDGCEISCYLSCWLNIARPAGCTVLLS